MIVENRKDLENIIKKGEMDLHPYRRTMLIGFLESLITFIAAFFTYDLHSPMIILSFMLIGATWFIWKEIFASPTMLAQIILKRKKNNDCFKMTQHILKHNNIRLQDIIRILIIPDYNHSNWPAGVLVETTEGTSYYKKDETIKPQFYSKMSQNNVAITYNYTVQNGEIYFTKRNYYEDVRRRVLSKKIDKQVKAK